MWTKQDNMPRKNSAIVVFIDVILVKSSAMSPVKETIEATELQASRVCAASRMWGKAFRCF